MGKGTARRSPRNIQRFTGEPLLQTIIADICRRIQNGEWPIGAKLPGRHVLIKEYGVGMLTIQQAIAHMISGGLLTTIDRTGTFVARSVVPSDHSVLWNASPMPAPPCNSMMASTTVKPLVGVLILGAYVPDDQSPVPDHWGNIAALAIERSLSDVGGRAYFEYIGPHSGPNCSDDIEFHRHNINVRIVVDCLGMLNHLPQYLLQFETQAIPTVIVGDDGLVTTLPLVSYDQKYAGYLAAEHLIRCGYQEMLFYRPFAARWVDERLEGIRVAMARHHWSPDALTIYPDALLSDEVAYYETYLHANRTEVEKNGLAETVFAPELLAYALPAARRAIIAANDSLALGIMRLLQSHGVIAGRDYGMIGFDDDRCARDLGLTTLRPPMDAMGRAAVQVAGALLRHEVNDHQVRMRSCLIERASTPLAMLYR